MAKTQALPTIVGMVTKGPSPQAFHDPFEEAYRRVFLGGRQHAPIPLTGPHINQLHRLVQAPMYAPRFAETGINNPHLRLFIAHFDGTWNDRENLGKCPSKTLPALLYESLIQQSPENVHAEYVNGVGTNTSKILHGLHGITGEGCKQRAEHMHQKLCQVVQAWLQQSPMLTVHVHAVGFSRGGATALHFLNMVNDWGVLDPNAPPPPHSANLQAGAVKSSALLFDVVATGQGALLNLTVPNTTQAVLHLTAGAEERRLFKVHSISDTPSNTMDNHEWALAQHVACPSYPFVESDNIFTSKGSFFYPRIQQVTLAGVRHSDVGGTYRPHGIAGVPMYLARTFQNSLGIPGAQPVLPRYKDLADAQTHDSRDSLELAFQLLDRVRILGHKKPLVLASKRAPMAQEKPWDGTLIRTLHFILLNDKDKEVRSKTVRAIVRPSLQPDGSTPTWDGIERSASFSAQEDGTFALLQDDSNLFAAQGHGVWFQGVRIDDAKAPQSICKEALSDPSLHVHIKVSDQRLLCGLQEGPLATDRPQIFHVNRPMDPWPNGIVRMIRFLNERTHIDPSQPHEKSLIDPVQKQDMVAQALREMGVQLGKEFPGFTHVDVHIGNLPDQEPNVRLEASDGLGKVSNQTSMATDIATIALQQRLSDCSDAIAHMANQLKRINAELHHYHVRVPLRQVDIEHEEQETQEQTKSAVSALKFH